MEYTRSPGKVIGRFLSDLRDNEAVHGIRDSVTSKVYVPPQAYGPESKTKMQTIVPLSSEASISYFTVVHEKPPFTDWEPPFAFVAVEFEGAHTQLWHRMKDTKGLSIGMKVKPKFKDENERSGSILDIDYFEPV